MPRDLIDYESRRIAIAEKKQELFRLFDSHTTFLVPLIIRSCNRQEDIFFLTANEWYLARKSTLIRESLNNKEKK